MDAQGWDGGLAAPHDMVGERAADASMVITEFESFYRSAYGPVAGALTYTLGDADLATEATDEAMVRAYARWSTVSVLGNPAGWVYRVGLNWGRSVHRRLTRRSSVPRPPDLAVPSAAGDYELREAVLELDVDLRAVVVCRHLLDWSVEQTAHALGLRPGTVKSRLHRAVGLLEARLSEDNDDPGVVAHD